MATPFLGLIVGFTVLLSLSSSDTSGASVSFKELYYEQRNLLDWPSLRFHYTIKRNSKQFNGRSMFTMLADPVVTGDGTRVLYDTLATFTDIATVTNYSLVYGISNVSREFVGNKTAVPSVGCLDVDVAPPVNAIASALNEATAVSTLSSSNSRNFECPNRSLFKVIVNGAGFRLCFTGASGFTLRGSDVDIKVEYLSNRVDVVVPSLDGHPSSKCAKMISSSLVTPVGKFLLTGQASQIDARSLKAALGLPFDGASSCSCKSTPRPCIFIHGQGVRVEMPENQDSFPTRYWGNMTDHAPCCTSIKYAVLNTVNHSWTQGSQQQKVCDRALAVSDTSTDSTISDTIIVTHSMGAPMLSGAIAAGKCSLVSSSTWISTGAPMRGSMGSDYLQGSCNGETNVIVEKLANVTGRCPVSKAIRSLAYENAGYASVKLNMAYKAAQKVYRTHVEAAMCSQKHSGLISSYQWQFWLLGRVIPQKSPHNDGMVEFRSCAGGIPESKFGNNYRDRFYVTKLNHFDVAFQSGDALFDEAKMPVKWFECLL